MADEGFATAAAGSIHKAQIEFSSRRPDVVLIDLQLPDGNGMELFSDIESRTTTEIVTFAGRASLDTADRSAAPWRGFLHPQR